MRDGGSGCAPWPPDPWRSSSLPVPQREFFPYFCRLVCISVSVLHTKSFEPWGDARLGGEDGCLWVLVVLLGHPVHGPHQRPDQGLHALGVDLQEGGIWCVILLSRILYSALCIGAYQRPDQGLQAFGVDLQDGGGGREVFIFAFTLFSGCAAGGPIGNFANEHQRLPYPKISE